MLPYVMEIRPPPEFNVDSARSKLINLNLATDDGPRVDLVTPGDVSGARGDDGQGDGSGRHEQLLRLAGWIDIENSVGVSSKNMEQQEQC